MPDVIEAVQLHLVSLAHHALDQVGMAQDAPSHHEEGGPHPGGREGVEHPRGPNGIRPVVEGQRGHTRPLPLAQHRETQLHRRVAPTDANRAAITGQVSSAR